MALISTMKNAVWISLWLSLASSALAQSHGNAHGHFSAVPSPATNEWRSPYLGFGSLPSHRKEYSLSANVGMLRCSGEAPKSAIRRKAMPPPLSAYFQVGPQAQVQVYRYEELALFCKLEVLMERQVGLPIKVRLGEVNAVERLEGKPYSPFLVR